MPRYHNYNSHGVYTFPGLGNRIFMNPLFIDAFEKFKRTSSPFLTPTEFVKMGFAKSVNNLVFSPFVVNVNLKGTNERRRFTINPYHNEWVEKLRRDCARVFNLPYADLFLNNVPLEKSHWTALTHRNCDDILVQLNPNAPLSPLSPIEKPVYSYSIKPHSIQRGFPTMRVNFIKLFTNKFLALLCRNVEQLFSKKRRNETRFTILTQPHFIERTFLDAVGDSELYTKSGASGICHYWSLSGLPDPAHAISYMCYLVAKRIRDIPIVRINNIAVSTNGIDMKAFLYKALGDIDFPDPITLPSDSDSDDDEHPLPHHETRDPVYSDEQYKRAQKTHTLPFHVPVYTDAIVSPSPSASSSSAAPVPVSYFNEKATCHSNPKVRQAKLDKISSFLKSSVVSAYLKQLNGAECILFAPINSVFNTKADLPVYPDIQSYFVTEFSASSCLAPGHLQSESIVFTSDDGVTQYDVQFLRNKFVNLLSNVVVGIVDIHPHPDYERCVIISCKLSPL